MTPNAIEIRDLHRRFGAVRAVDGLNLSIGRGESVAVLGPNGAGKSTTIAMLLGLLAPDAGSVAVWGMAPGEAVARGHIAAMLQEGGLMPGVKVAELVGFVRGLYPPARLPPPGHGGRRLRLTTCRRPSARPEPATGSSQPRQPRQTAGSRLIPEVRRSSRVEFPTVSSLSQNAGSILDRIRWRGQVVALAHPSSSVSGKSHAPWPLSGLKGSFQVNALALVPGSENPFAV